MKRSKSIMATLILMVISTLSSAFEYKMRVNTSEKLSSWESVSPTVHFWINDGEHYDCEAWDPNENTIAFGLRFPQSRDCNQSQLRKVEIREHNSFSGTIKTVNTVQENRVVTEEEVQNTIGSYRNWVPHESTFTNWTDIGLASDYSQWFPLAVIQTSDFNQERTYQKTQQRFEQKIEIDTGTNEIRDIGDLIKHSQDINESESRNVIVSYTGWHDEEPYQYDCNEWIPNANTVEVGKQFVQTSQCKLKQTRYRRYMLVGQTISFYLETQIINDKISSNAVGTRKPYRWTQEGGHSSQLGYPSGPFFRVGDVCTAYNQTRIKSHGCNWNPSGTFCTVYTYRCK